MLSLGRGRRASSGELNACAIAAARPKRSPLCWQQRLSRLLKRPTLIYWVYICLFVATRRNRRRPDAVWGVVEALDSMLWELLPDVVVSMCIRLRIFDQRSDREMNEARFQESRFACCRCRPSLPLRFPCSCRCISHHTRRPLPQATSIQGAYSVTSSFLLCSERRGAGGDELSSPEQGGADKGGEENSNKERGKFRQSRPRLRLQGTVKIRNVRCGCKTDSV
jgi:hypothetical protein